jgi:hypothetical protein
MRLSAVIVSYRSRDDLLDCLASVEADAAGLETETIVIDNDSRDGAAAAVAERFPAVRVIENAENLGFARAVNQGIAATRGAYVLILNPDCIVRPGALRALIGQLAGQPRCGIAAPRVFNPDGSLDYTARTFPGPMAFLFNRYSLLTRMFPRNRWSRRYLMSDWDHASVRDVDWVSGACMLARREAIEQVGALDEAYFMFNEDVDWCRRMGEAGWTVTYVPSAEVIHRVGASRRRVSARVIVERHRGMIRYFHKYHRRGRAVTTLADAMIMARAGVMVAANALRRRR